MGRTPLDRRSGRAANEVVSPFDVHRPRDQGDRQPAAVEKVRRSPGRATMPNFKLVGVFGSKAIRACCHQVLAKDAFRAVKELAYLLEPFLLAESYQQVLQ